jgi:hypothetical protein
MMATGVASPSAHGQEITSTEIPLASAKAGAFPAASQITVVTAAMLLAVYHIAEDHVWFEFLVILVMNLK